MTVYELKKKTNSVVTETRNALQTVYNAMNYGQQKKIVKDESVKTLFDRYGVEYTQ